MMIMHQIREFQFSIFFLRKKKSSTVLNALNNKIKRHYRKD